MLAQETKGTFLTLVSFVSKKRPKIKQEEAVVGPFKSIWKAPFLMVTRYKAINAKKFKPKKSLKLKVDCSCGEEFVAQKLFY